jgi:hypothetical protein
MISRGWLGLMVWLLKFDSGDGGERKIEVGGGEDFEVGDFWRVERLSLIRSQKKLREFHPQTRTNSFFALLRKTTLPLQL